MSNSRHYKVVYPTYFYRLHFIKESITNDLVGYDLPFLAGRGPKSSPLVVKIHGTRKIFLASFSRSTEAIKIIILKVTFQMKLNRFGAKSSYRVMDFLFSKP